MKKKLLLIRLSYISTPQLWTFQFTSPANRAPPSSPLPPLLLSQKLLLSDPFMFCLLCLSWKSFSISMNRLDDLHASFFFDSGWMPRTDRICLYDSARGGWSVGIFVGLFCWFLGSINPLTYWWTFFSSFILSSAWEKAIRSIYEIFHYKSSFRRLWLLTSDLWPLISDLWLRPLPPTSDYMCMCKQNSTDWLP